MTGRVFVFLYSLVYVKNLFSGVKVQWISRVIALREWDFNAFWFTERSRVWRIVYYNGRTDRNGVEQPVGISHTQANAAFRSLSAEQVVVIGGVIFCAKVWLLVRMFEDFTFVVRSVLS